MVSIISSCIIIPSEPTPNGLMNLSELDQIPGMKHVPPLLFFFKSNPAGTFSDLTQKLKDSLSKILVPYYPLAGRLSRIDGRFELDCNGHGVEFVEAKSNETKVVDDYIDFEPTEVVKDFIPSIDYNKIPLEEWPLLLVQLTKFRCGGVCFGIAFSHTVCDGWAQLMFFNAWTKLVREEDNCQVHGETMQPLHDRTFLNSTCHSLPRFDHREFKAPPVLLNCSATTKTEQEQSISVSVLRVSKEQIENLQKEAETKSTYEAIAAHMWRCACKARQGHTNQPTTILSVVDIRRKLKPQIPLNYFGNAILHTLTPTCLFGEILTHPLSYTAQKVRESIQILTDEYIRSVIDFVKIQRQGMDSLRVGSPTGYYYGNPNLNIGCATSLPVYDVDFGWGKPVYVGLGTFINVDGRSFIMPGPAGDGSIVITLRLQTQHMEAFKKFFYGDIGQFCKSKL
ncbi:Hydroxycinnamoyl transferase [Quillaja saponaria]|uniref:Hydroxycinnamoyl transferase n=1 Tax=Quillaja saponaria TaxID=32244 RepID=A0AAD7VNB4_QUISA|nr:Hydroxycinnamoyl transferase [Quillaja saponaria]